MIETCWVVTEGKAGMELQGLALAEALGARDTRVKRVSLKSPWRHLSPWLRLGKRFCLAKASDPLDPPYPNVAITVGRRSVLAGLLIKRNSPSTKLICAQNPYISTKHFDIAIVAAHDGVKPSPNVVSALGSLHAITSRKLALAKAEFKDAFAAYPSPRLGVIIGGNSRAYRMDSQTIKNIFERLETIRRSQNGSLLITSSRRTPRDVADYLAAHRSSRVFYGHGGDSNFPNPYLGILGSADALFATRESVNMISEACATDVPVYLLPLPGHGARIAKFSDSLIALKRVEWFDDKVEFKRVEPVDTMGGVVAEVNRLLGR